MTYRVFYTDVPLPHGQNEPHYERLIPFSFDTKELAIVRAFKIIDQRAIVWRIDGPEQFLMNRSEIDVAYFQKTGRDPQT